MIRFALFALALVSGTAHAAHAATYASITDEPHFDSASESRRSLRLGAAFFQQFNNYEASGAKMVLSYDAFFTPFASISPRLGMVAGEAAAPFGGLQLSFWTSRETLRPRARFGVVADLYANTGSQFRDPVFLYTGIEAGARVPLSREWFMDVPVEIGMFPIFADTVYAWNMGLQIGTAF